MGGVVPLSHVVLMSRHALTYLLPSVSIVMLLLVAATAQIPINTAMETLWSILLLEPEYRILAVIGYSFWLAFCLILGIKMFSFLRDGGKVKIFIQVLLLSGAMMGFSCFQILGGILKSIFCCPVEFEPTGSGSSPSVNLISIWGGMVWVWAIYAFIAALLISKPGLLLFGLNFLWITILVTAPFGLNWFHRNIE